MTWFIVLLGKSDLWLWGQRNQNLIFPFTTFGKGMIRSFFIIYYIVISSNYKFVNSTSSYLKIKYSLSDVIRWSQRSLSYYSMWSSIHISVFTSLPSSECFMQWNFSDSHLWFPVTIALTTILWKFPTFVKS